jgi:hypothetical protein
MKILQFEKERNSHLTPKNQILLMTRIDVGLMGIYSNCHGHNNYENE